MAPQAKSRSRPHPPDKWGLFWSSMGKRGHLILISNDHTRSKEALSWAQARSFLNRVLQVTQLIWFKLYKLSCRYCKNKPKQSSVLTQQPIFYTGILWKVEKSYGQNCWVHFYIKSVYKNAATKDGHLQTKLFTKEAAILASMLSIALHYSTSPSVVSPYTFKPLASGSSSLLIAKSSSMASGSIWSSCAISVGTLSFNSGSWIAARKVLKPQKKQRVHAQFLIKVPWESCQRNLMELSL